MADDFRVTGSGSHLAMGVLETLFQKNMPEDDAVKLVVKALNSAVQRDLATGNGIDVVVITTDGVKKVMSKEIDTNLKL